MSTYYQNQPYPNDYNNRGRGGYNNRNQEPPKRSGAKEGIISKGKNAGKGMIYISAWKVNKRHGMVSIKAFENAKSKRWESDRGKKHVSLIFEVIFKDQGNTMVIPANYCMTTGKAFLDQLGWVVSTQARRGGYCGPISTK